MRTTTNTTGMPGDTAVMDQNIYSRMGQHISWGAIVAGALIALAVHVVLAALGAGIGLTAYDPMMGDRVSQGTLIAAAIFGVVATVVSMLAGGYVTGKLSGVVERMHLGLHGLTMWALTTVFVFTGFAMGAGSVFATMARSYGINYEGLTRLGNGAMTAGGVPAVTESAINAGAMSSWFAFLTLVISAAASTFGAIIAANYMASREVVEPRTRTTYKPSGATAGM